MFPVSSVKDVPGLYPSAILPHAHASSTLTPISATSSSEVLTESVTRIMPEPGTTQSAVTSANELNNGSFINTESGSLEDDDLSKQISIFDTAFQNSITETNEKIEQATQIIREIDQIIKLYNSNLKQKLDSSCRESLEKKLKDINNRNSPIYLLYLSKLAEAKHGLDRIEKNRDNYIKTIAGLSNATHALNKANRVREIFFGKIITLRDEIKSLTKHSNTATLVESPASATSATPIAVPAAITTEALGAATSLGIPALTDNIPNSSLTAKQKELQNIAIKVGALLVLKINIINTNENDAAQKELPFLDELREINNILESLETFVDSDVEKNLTHCKVKLDTLYESQLEEFKSHSNQVIFTLNVIKRVKDSNLGKLNGALTTAKATLTRTRDTIEKNISELEKIAPSQRNSANELASAATTSAPAPARASSTLAPVTPITSSALSITKLPIINKTELVDTVNSVNQELLKQIYNLIYKQTEISNLLFWKKQTTGMTGGRQFTSNSENFHFNDKIPTGMAEILTRVRDWETDRSCQESSADYNQRISTYAFWEKKPEPMKIKVDLEKLLVVLSKEATARLQKFSFGRKDSQKEFYMALAALYSYDKDGKAILNVAILPKIIEKLQLIDSRVTVLPSNVLDNLKIKQALPKHETENTKTKQVKNN